MEFVINATIVSAVLFLVALLAGAYWVMAKRYLSEIRKLIVELDDAITDDRITEEEWNKIWAALMELIDKN